VTESGRKKVFSSGFTITRISLYIETLKIIQKSLLLQIIVRNYFYRYIFNSSNLLVFIYIARIYFDILYFYHLLVSLSIAISRANPAFT